MVIELPWPDKRLSPNARVHWAVLSRVKRLHRHDAYWATMAAGKIEADRVNVALKFCPPDNRNRDLDNLIASMKASLDGISDAIGIDDSRWGLSAVIGPAIDGGRVYVTVTP